MSEVLGDFFLAEPEAVLLRTEQQAVQNLSGLFLGTYVDVVICKTHKEAILHSDILIL